MSIGTVSLNTSHKKEPTPAPGPPFALNSAYNGCSVDVNTGQIVWGNDFGDPLQQAQLVSFREIDMKGFSMFFDISSNAANMPFRFVAIGQNPFILDGISIQENMTAFPLSGGNNRIGINIDAVDVAQEMFWARLPSNDGFELGCSNNIGSVFDFFFFWDATGNLVLCDTSFGTGTDVGIRFFVNGDMGMTTLPTTANPVKAVAWDTVTMRLVDAGGSNAALNGLSVDSSGNIVLGNDVGDALAPAALISNREITDGANFFLQFSDTPGSVDNLQINSQHIAITDALGNNSLLVSTILQLHSAVGWATIPIVITLFDDVVGSAFITEGIFDTVNGANAGAVNYRGTHDAGLYFLDSGNIQLIPGNVPVADSGSFFQIGGQTEVTGDIIPDAGFTWGLGSNTRYYQRGFIDTVNTNRVFNAAFQSVVAGSVGGNATFSQPEQGSSYKKSVIFLNNLTGTASYTFPTPFTNTPVILTTSGLAAGIITTLNTTTVICTGAGTTGFLFVEGF